MKLSKSSIEGAWLVNPIRHGDERGWFQEWFKKSEVERQIGFSFEPVQLNISYSQQGVVRGIHYSIAAEGQAKLVTVMAGEIDDYAIDLRPGSPTFGRWERLRLSSSVGNSVLLGPNLAHAFQCVSEQATVCYATSAEFNPESEKAINPLCPTLKIEWDRNFPILLSPKDEKAPNMDQQNEVGLLPRL
jgi:dTDP-4-dehydrorhamnose 3,5-epimerase